MHKTMCRWILWPISIVALLSLVTVAGIWFYTQTDQFRVFLRAQLMTALNDALNGEVQFGEITGSVWNKVHVRNVVVLQHGEPVLSAPAITAEVGLLGQLYTLIASSAVRIAQVDIAEPELQLVQDKDNNWNVMTLLKKPDEEAGRLTVVLDNIGIENGKIEVTAANGKKARITALSAQGGLNLRPSGVEVGLDKLDFALSSPAMPNSTWASALSFEQSGKKFLFNIKRLHVSTSGSRLNLSGTIRDLSNPTVQLTMEIVKGSAKEITTLLPALPLRQDISARVRASGPLSALQVSGRLAAADGQLAASLVTDWTPSEPRFQGKLEFREFVLDKVLTVAGVNGELNGRLDFQESSVEQIQLSAQSRVSGLVVKGWDLGDVALSGRLKDRTVTFAAHVDHNGSRSAIEGNIVLAETPAYDLMLQARSVDFKTVAGNGADIPAGDINFDAWIKGRGIDLKTMQLDARLRFLPSEIGGVELKQGRAEGSLRDGALTLRQASFEADGSTLNASGKLASVTRSLAGTITYDLNLRELKPWLKLVGLDGSGKAKLDGTLSGSLETPRWEGKVSVSDLRLAGARVESGSAKWTFMRTGNDRWRGRLNLAAKQLTAGIPLADLEADFTLVDRRPVTVGAAIVARDLDQRLYRVKGQVVHSAGRTDALLQDITFQLPNGTWRNPRPARFVLAGKNLTVENFQLQRESQLVTIKGSTGWQGGQDLAVQVSHFPLADLRPYLKEAPAVTGELSLEMEVKGTAARPLIEATMSVAKFSLAGQPYAGLAGRGSYQGERLNVDLRLRQDDTHSLTVNGTLPVYLGWGGPRAPAVLGETNLWIHSDGLSPAFLNVLSKDIDNLQGSLTVDIRLRGPLQSLTPTGTIQLQGGAARVRPLALTLTDIALQANVAPGAIQISRLIARSGAGKLDGNGQLAFKGLDIAGIALALSAADFQIINTREYKAAASGKLFASGTPQNPYLEGAATLKGTLRPDLALLKRNGLAAQDPTIVVVRKERDLAVMKHKRKATIVAEENPLYHRLGLDVSVTIARDTWIYLDAGSIEATGQLTLSKQAAQDLIITGTIQGLRGSYTFQGRRFQLEKAQLTFTGGNQINPGLDIVGRYRAPQYLIDLVLDGTMSKPTLSFRSDPALDQSDILSVLLFGRPTAALTQSQQTALKGQAVKLAADFFAADLTQSVARRLGLDILDFDVGDNQAQGQVGVGIGKYITQDVFVSTRQQFGNEQEQEYSVEYNIAPNWQIKSSTNPKGDSGVDVFWRKQY